MRDTVILSKRLRRHRSSKCSNRSNRRDRAGGEIAGYTKTAHPEAEAGGTEAVFGCGRAIALAAGLGLQLLVASP